MQISSEMAALQEKPQKWTLKNDFSENPPGFPQNSHQTDQFG